MKFDKYELFARVCPAIICSLPIFFFYHFFINLEFSNLFHSTLNLTLIAEVPTSLALLFVFYQTIRTVGKIIESIYFGSEKKLPTTEYLLYSNNEYSSSYKKKIREKGKREFGSKFLDVKKENEDASEARKLINEFVRQVRNKVKDGRLVLNRNIEYGFFRNLIAGSLMALPISLYSIYFFIVDFPSPLAVKAEIFSSILFGTLLLSSYPLLKFLGKNYANVLYQEYLSI